MHPTYSRRSAATARHAWRLVFGGAAAIALVIALPNVSSGGSSQQSIQSLPGGTPTPNKVLVFEAASIKRNTSGDNGVRVQFQPGGRFNGLNVTLQTLVRNAYRLQPFEMIGGPSWFATDRFDIVAKAADNAPPVDMIEMVKALMADRFKFAFHRETRELPIYELVVLRPDGKLGPQLKPSAVDCSGAMRGAPPPTPATPPATSPTQGARPTCGMRISGATLIAGGATLAQLASNLSNAVGRTVVDKTGLAGGYDMDLSFTPDATMRPPDAPPIAGDGPSLYTAVQEQLGLKLESAKGPVEVLVIDAAERPVEN